MAIAVFNQSSEWNAELYDQTVEKVSGGPITSENKPDGLMSHLAAPGADGGFQVVEVWESEEAWNTFLNEQLIPAVQEIGAPPFDTKILPVHAVLT